MSDARALLRQQRAARRITHPHAAYSDTGKLLCTLCREQVKAENLWDAHLQSPGHRKRANTAAPPPQPPSKEEEAADEEKETTTEAPAPTSHKRKIDDDEAMEDADDNAEALTRRKRSRPDLGRDSTEEATTSSKDRSLSIASNGINGMKDQEQTLTPPSLTRRSSATPSQGVEVQIPSRPATPRESTTNSASTTRTLPSRQASSIALQGQTASSTTPTSVNGQTQKLPPTVGGDNSGKKAEGVDEDEWAAFEADVAAATYNEADATISAPAMTAAESEAAKAAAEAEEDDGDPRRRTSKPEADLADEREDARRAIEEELDEMHNLEAKVLKFKEQRDALRRRRAESQGQQDAEEGQKKAKKDLLGKENVGNSVAVVEEDEDEEEEEDEDDEDDWDGFRFRTAVAR